MAFKDKFTRIKDWMVSDEQLSEEEYEGYEDYEEEYEEDEGEYVSDDDYEEKSYSSITSRRMPEYSSHNQMKVVIVEPKIYEDAATISDHLKLRKTVIVNLEKMTDKAVRKSIFDFINGSIYVLDGEIERVSKYIFILAPKNVDVDNNVKKELESKAIFPWQNK